MLSDSGLSNSGLSDSGLPDSGGHVCRLSCSRGRTPHIPRLQDPKGAKRNGEAGGGANSGLVIIGGKKLVVWARGGGGIPFPVHYRD